VWEGPTTVRVLTETDELNGGDVLPGFRLLVAALFQTSF
jgi:pantothenate kinase type III